MDWIYGQIVGFLGNFFALMGNMGVELFELEWVSAIILFFSRLACYRTAYYIASGIYVVACMLLMAGLWKYNRAAPNKEEGRS